jgi:hypothetical protein
MSREMNGNVSGWCAMVVFGIRSINSAGGVFYPRIEGACSTSKCKKYN